MKQKLLRCRARRWGDLGRAILFRQRGILRCGLGLKLRATGIAHCGVLQATALAGFVEGIGDLLGVAEGRHGLDTLVGEGVRY